MPWVTFNSTILISATQQSETVNLNHIDLALPKGKTLGIVGKTGSGKTTLIRQLLNQFPTVKARLPWGAMPIATIKMPRSEN